MRVRRVQACCMQNLTHCGAKSCAPGPGAPQTQHGGCPCRQSVDGRKSTTATDLSASKLTNRMSKSREQIGKNQLRHEDLLKPPFGRESTCRTTGEDCSTPKFSLPILLHRRTVYDAYSAPRAFPHPSCSQLGCCVPTMPKPCCCPSAATHKMCRQVCGVGASAAAAQPQCLAYPLPRRRVLD